MWNCAAIKHGVAIFPNGKIGPCCQVSADYLKPIAELNNPDRFADLATATPPAACQRCVANEYNRIPSYRNFFNSKDNKQAGLQFVDIRNTNVCNLKCRYCGPHFSSQWAEELGRYPAIERQDLTDYQDTLITDSLQWMYFTGGEPMINPDHWAILTELVASNRAQDIALMYNTNLTTLKYKDIDIVDLWRQFRRVDIKCSIDAVGPVMEAVRSGASWARTEQNLAQLQAAAVNTHIAVSFEPVLSILNVWTIAELYQYAASHSIPVNLNILTGPDYLALDVVPDSLQSLALEQIDLLEQYPVDANLLDRARQLIQNNHNQCLFPHTLSHILLLDQQRGERLFELLPFKQLAQDIILNNHEYE